MTRKRFLLLLENGTMYLYKSIYNKLKLTPKQHQTKLFAYFVCYIAFDAWNTSGNVNCFGIMLIGLIILCVCVLLIVP